MEYAKRYGTAAAVAVAALAMAVAGCGPTPSAEGDKPSTTLGIPPVPSGPADATATAPATTGVTAGRNDPAPQEVLVEVVVNGGFAGVTNKLVVHYDGTYTLRSGTKPAKEGRMTAAGAAALRAALEDPAYAKVPARPTGAPAADGFSFYITHAYRLVVTQDGENRPPALQRVLDALPGGGPPTSP
ncbi:hypothetical protein [Streptomyces sp. NPDC126499]|uniref:hypothetical protein n=1 Tax=Streptomyces sp. NPDC126499 TaxID=3155314 RepID=UPI003320C614